MDLKAASSDPDIRNLVVLQGPQYGGIVLPAAASPRYDHAHTPAIPGLGDPAHRGTIQGSGPATLTITGLWGGLRFAQELRVDLPSTSGAGAAGAGIWAYQQGEAWARGQVKYDVEAVKKLGKDYHIVNRQMSLLALEPGMDLWAEMPAKMLRGPRLRRCRRRRAWCRWTAGAPSWARPRPRPWTRPPWKTS